MESRLYRVVRKVRESDVITSFYLEAADGAPLDPFDAGQFLTFAVALNDSDNSEIRQYSLSNSPHVRDHYRITVKREAPPPDQPDLPPGAISTHLHDTIEVGHTLAAHAPRGQFVLDKDSTRPVVLLSGGVGLTPTVSMLHALAAAGGRDVWFIHACDNGRLHAMSDEVRELAERFARIHTHFCYRFPDAEDLASGRCDSTGLISRELLQSLLPIDDYEFYLCGPTPFMKAVYDVLRSLGVHNDRIRFEFFGPATLFFEPEERTDDRPAVVEGVERALPGDQPVAVPQSAAAPDAAEADGPMVTFRKAGITVPWRESANTLLEFAESLGLEPEFSCRAGVCNTCISRLVAGEVEYIEEPLDDPEEGMALICCSRPRTDVELDI